MTPAPGTCYKFTVGSAEEAASLIRERLGPDARVLSVRSVDQPGLSRLWSKPRLEVVAQIGAPAAPDPAAEGSEPAEMPATWEVSSDEVEMPDFTAAPTVATRPAAEPAPRRLSARPAADLSGLLKRSGLSDLALGRLQTSPFWPKVEHAPLHRALVDIGWHIRKQAEDRRTGGPLRRAAFFGTAGCGRTTALCKWIGLEVFRRARSGHVVTVEFDRPNPTGTLPVFAEALGVPVARFPAATEPVVPGGFVYFDLPGISLRDSSANRPLREFLDAEKIAERVLVLNAAYDHAVLRAAYASARDLGATHVVFTHLDELTQWGRLWDYLLDGALQPLFLATGPSLTGDCEEDVFGALVRRTLAADLAPDSAAASSPAPALALRS